jgi:hypothetical protein
MATLSSIITPTNILTESSTDTLTNKTISGADNTLTNVPLATAVTGTLPAANGGTGLTAPGTSGNILTSDGTNWTSTAPAASGSPVGALQYFAGETTTTYPGSDWIPCDGSVYTQTAYSTLFSRIGLLANNNPINWTARTPAAGGQPIYGILYANNIFVYVADGGVLATSTNAITWTARTPAFNDNTNLIYTIMVQILEPSNKEQVLI